MVRIHERGSSLWYIVVGVLLAASVVGGVYFVKHQLQGQLAGKSSATVATTDKNSSDTKKKSDGASPTSENKATTGDKNTAAPSGSTDQQTPSSSSKDTTAPAPTPTTSAPSSSTSTTPTGSNLPQTGPASVIGTATILAMLFGAYVAYRRSLKV